MLLKQSIPSVYDISVQWLWFNKSIRERIELWLHACMHNPTQMNSLKYKFVIIVYSVKWSDISKISYIYNDD